MITDCHTHWGMGYTERDGEDPTAWLGVLDRHHVARAFLFGYANIVDAVRCAEDNNRLARLAARVPGRLIPFGSCWPQQGARAVAEAARCLGPLGMPGLKLHPWLQGFSTALPAMDEICRLAAERRAPILFHDGTPCYCLTEQIVGLARRFPATRIVLGHAGLLWNWRSALEAATLPNVWICLCGPHMRAMEILAQRLPPDRLLWGSDFGFPADDPIDYRLNLLRRAKIDGALRLRILEHNPAQLLNSQT